MRLRELIPSLQLSLEPVMALTTLSKSFAELLNKPQTAALFRMIIAEGERFPELKDVIYRHGRDPFKAKLIDLLASFSDRGLIEVAGLTETAEFYINMLCIGCCSPRFSTKISTLPKNALILSVKVR